MEEGEEGTEFVIFLSKQAYGFLEQINKADIRLAERISQLLNSLETDPYSHKLLAGRKKGSRAARIGNYRIIYKIRNHEVFIESIKHRRESYRD